MSSCINMRAVVIMLLLIAHFTLVAAQDPIYVLDMMSAISTTPAEASINLGFNEALRVGILAAMTAANFTTTNGQEIILIPTNLTSSSDAVAALEAALADPTTADLITVYGPVGDDPLQALMSSSALLDHDLTCFAPVTGSRQVRAAWSPHVYFTFASPTVHFLNVLQYIVGTMAVRRIGMIYFDGSQFGPLELESLNTQLASIDYDPAIVLSPPLGAPLDMNLINEFLEKEPQAVLISSFSSDSLRILMQAILLDPRSSGVPFFSTTLTEYALTELYADLVAAGSVVAEANKLVFASNSPSPYDLSVSFISRFQQEVHAYEQHPLLFGHSASLYNPHYAEVMLIGWTSAKLLLRTLNDPQWTSSRASYMSELFDQRQYLLEEDLVYGDYGGNCSASAVASGAVCSCNSGGRQSFLKFLDQNFNFSMTEHSVVSIPRTQCLVSTTGALLHQSTAFFLVSTNDAVSQYISAAMFAAARAASSITVSGIDGEATVHLAEVSTTSSQYQATFNTRLRNFREDIVLGMLPAYVSATDILVLDPVSPQAVVAAGARNSIFLMPTLRQQLYVFAAYQAQVKPSAIHAILRSTEAEVIREVLEASLETFELDLDSSTLLRETAQMDVLGERLPTSGTIFFTGATNRTAERDLTFLMEQVASYPQLQVVMSFDDVASNYNILLPILDVADDATLQRIFFCTSLPHWGDALSTSESVQRYHTLITDPLEWSPRSMQGYVVEQFAKRVLILSSDRSYASLLRSIYSNQNFMVDDLFFGQYMDDCDEMHESCVPSNYGATNIRVWSFARITNPQVPVTFGPLTPVLTYTSRAKSSKLSTGAIVGITVGVVAAIAIFIIILLLVCCCCCCNGTRQQSNAPAKPSEPLTLLFTDIEASTTLWSTIPQFMPEALSAHHRIIRQLIVKHHCYEVKTIGDSFMIAAKNPYTAALLAQDIQHALFRHDWKSTNCDQIYLNMEEDMAEMDADFILTATTLEAKTYAEQWSGLRVRIGIHTGICTIRDDHVTHGFDYSGDTALIASHTEALGHGGQVVLTSHAWFAMTEAERQTLRISRLGPHRIRGSPQPINFYQLNTVPGRTFRPLRVEQTLVEENDDSEAMTDPFCEGIPLTGPAEILSTVLSASFAPFTPLQRIGELQTLLRRWQSEVPHQPRDQTNLDYSNGLLRRMVVHLAQQLDPKEALQLLRPTRGEHSKVLHASPSIAEESRADPATLRCDQQQYTVAGTHGPSTGPEPTTDSADGPPSSTERADSKAPEPAQRQLGQSQSFEPLQAIGLHPAHRPMPHPASIDTIFLE